MKKLLLTLFLISFILIGSKQARAVVIWDQPGTGDGRIAQIFTDAANAPFSAFEFDDFNTSIGYFIETLTAYGVENGDPGQNVDIVGEIWNALPGIFGGSIVMTSLSGSENLTTANLTIDFGGQFLPAGNYWVTAYVVRPFDTGDQWFWTTTDTITGNEAYFYNPGGGFGVGTDPIPGSNIHFDGERDMAFTLEGSPVPEPATMLLISTGLAGLAGFRRKFKMG